MTSLLRRLVSPLTAVFTAPGARRFRTVTLVLGESGLLLVSVLAAIVLRPDTSPHPDRVNTQVSNCDLAAHGSAAVTFDLNNADIAVHSYQVHLTVVAGGSTLGSGTSLVNHVAARSTVTARMLVPVRGNVNGATCKLWADAWEGPTGHEHA